MVDPGRNLVRNFPTDVQEEYSHVMSVVAFTVIGTFDVLTAAQMPALWRGDLLGVSPSDSRKRTHKTPMPNKRLRSSFFCRLNCSFQTISTGMNASAKSRKAQ